MLILGQSLLVWLGVLAAKLLAAAVAAVYLGRRYKKIARGRWHHKLALAAVLIAALHVVLAVLQVFFQIHL